MLISAAAPAASVPEDGPKSPLFTSWTQYLQHKASSEFGLQWIHLGPVMNSARVEAVQCDPHHPGTWYAAFGSGNLWKTINHGLTWKPIFENQSALGIGDIALAPSNPEIIWLGSGESLKKARNFTMPGTGVFRSDDGGKTWRNMGLHDSWHIGEIAVHPQNPNLAVVAVMGHFWSTNPNRGLYRTEDGGKTWEHVLYVNNKVGANDVVISPSHPEIMYASLWENNPTIYGPESGIYKSSDSGRTWIRLHGGLPDGHRTGRIGLAVSWSDPDKAYALIDNLNKDSRKAAEVYRTDDGGSSWKRTHEEDLLIFPGIGWYFTDCYVNPQDDEEIFALGVRMAVSRNGGKNFQLVGGNVFHLFPNDSQTLHLDHCELWINPLNPDFLALGNDGGFYASYDKGESWMHYNNIPAGEFYDISLDNQEPYHIYGGTQDDSSVYGPSIEWNPLFADLWKYVWLDSWSGGDGCYNLADPEDPNIVYFSSQNGAIRRKFMDKDRSLHIRPRLPKEHPGQLKYNFVAPYIISPHNAQTLYHAGNFLFKSIDRGNHWDLISPDLAKPSDPEKQSTAAGAVAESPLVPGLLYIGTDKGAFWVTQNDGQAWKEHSGSLPPAYIRSISPSRFNQSRVYITLTGINTDDLSNHLYVSENYGQNWKSISSNLPDEIANCIIEDPVHENILYAGLYRGVYISTDRGGSWSLLGPDMAATCISDLVIQEREMDLVAGTHGRGIYKINLRPIQQAFSEGRPDQPLLFEIPTATLPWVNDTHRDFRMNTLQKVPITIYLPEAKNVTLVLKNRKDETVWTHTVQARKGFNQIRWDLIVRRVDSPEAYFVHYNEFIRPGTYTLTIRGQRIDLSGKLTVRSRKSPKIE